MKIHVAETVTLELADATLTINVEDASKGDTISGKILTVSSESGKYKVGGIYEFTRDSIKSS